MHAAWSGTPTTKAARVAYGPSTPTRRGSATGSSWSAWCASKAASARSMPPSRTPTLRRGRSIRASAPGRRRRARSSPRARCCSPMRRRQARSTCSIRRGHPTGAASGWCPTPGSSGRGAPRACTTGCATGSTRPVAGCANASPPEPRGSGAAAPRREGLAELLHLRCDDEGAIAGVGMALEVALVVGLGRPPVVLGLDLGDGANAVRGQFGDDLSRDAHLLVAMRVDARAVLRADIVALAIRRGRVVDREEDLEQVAKADALRVVGDAHDLGVAGVAAADLLVARPRDVAVAVARFDAEHAVDIEIDGFEAPEAAAGERGDLGGGRRVGHGGLRGMRVHPIIRPRDRAPVTPRTKPSRRPHNAAP